MKKLSQKRKKLLVELNNYTCEQCKKVFKLGELQIHRIKRGNQGGNYEHRNCKILCKKCHQLYHGNEFRNVNGK